MQADKRCNGLDRGFPVLEIEHSEETARSASELKDVQCLMLEHGR